MVKNNKNNSSNSLVFGRWPQTKIATLWSWFGRRCNSSTFFWKVAENLKAILGLCKIPTGKRRVIFWSHCLYFTLQGQRHLDVCEPHGASFSITTQDLGHSVYEKTAPKQFISKLTAMMSMFQTFWALHRRWICCKRLLLLLLRWQKHHFYFHQFRK